jgi:hypothetical protein
MPSLDSKRRGDLAELAFLLKATQLGLIVCKPYGDGLPLDFIVLGGARLSRVQVKSIHRLTPARGHYHVTTKRRRAGRTRPYSRRDVDVLAVYIQPEDTWYLLPPRAFRNRQTLHFYPRHLAARRRFRAYRERWSLFFSQDSRSG